MINVPQFYNTFGARELKSLSVLRSFSIKLQMCSEQLDLAAGWRQGEPVFSHHEQGLAGVDLNGGAVGTGHGSGTFQAHHDVEVPRDSPEAGEILFDGFA